MYWFAQFYKDAIFSLFLIVSISTETSHINSINYVAHQLPIPQSWDSNMWFKAWCINKLIWASISKKKKKEYAYLKTILHKIMNARGKRQLLKFVFMFAWDLRDWLCPTTQLLTRPYSNPYHKILLAIFT